MYDQKAIYQVIYNGETYSFPYGSHLYIFDTGVYNDIDIMYGMETLLEYVSLVHECYLKDSKNTNLGELAEYIAQNWLNVKDLGRYDILEKYYLECDAI